MATFTAVGPAFALDGPPPVAPPHSLLMTEGVVVERDATRVLNGVNVLGYPTGCNSIWEACSTGTFRVKDDDSEMPTSRFDAFAVVRPVTCSSYSFSDPQELFDRAEAVLDATISASVELALAEGVDMNPFFGDSNVDVLGGGAVKASVAQALLEDAIGSTCRQGMLHFTPGILAALQTWPVSLKDNTELVSVNGTPVVSGMGYQDVTTSDLSAPGATEDWAFATGPVRVYMGPIRLNDVKENLDRSDNTLTFRAERFVLALWDTALQAAALVDWST